MAGDFDESEPTSGEVVRCWRCGKVLGIVPLADGEGVHTCSPQVRPSPARLSGDHTGA
jgi:hypothetical protein